MVLDPLPLARASSSLLIAAILHRTSLCANLLVDVDGVVKLADFGAARYLGGSATAQNSINGQNTLTGTPFFMAPEVVKQSGWALQHASEGLKGDREVVMEAVKQSGRALQHANAFSAYVFADVGRGSIFIAVGGYAA